MAEIIALTLAKNGLTVDDIRARKVNLKQIRNMVRAESLDFAVFQAMVTLRCR